MIFDREAMARVHYFLLEGVAFEELELQVLFWWCLCCCYKVWNTVVGLFSF
jgi:hypothetical protein